MRTSTGAGLLSPAPSPSTSLPLHWEAPRWPCRRQTG